MATLNEMFGYEGKGSSLAMSTYSELEGAVTFPCQLTMTVNAKVDNLSSKAERKLVVFMKSTLGYSECVVDKENNTILVYSIDGIYPARILRYIKKYIDAEAR